ncbi:MAG: hypothetical protein PHP06_05935 [Clostridia bacterium]|nr:hypothetical protein [Clostridia bacterium]
MTTIKIQLTIKNTIPTKAEIAFLGKELFTELLHQKLIAQEREFFETCEDKPSWVLNVPAAIEAGYIIQDEYGTMISKSKRQIGKYVIANADWKESGKQKYLDSVGELEAFVASGAFQEW